MTVSYMASYLDGGGRESVVEVHIINLEHIKLHFRCTDEWAFAFRDISLFKVRLEMCPVCKSTHQYGYNRHMSYTM